jgi:hypothetical protein
MRQGISSSDLLILTEQPEGQTASLTRNSCIFISRTFISQISERGGGEEGGRNHHRQGLYQRRKEEGLTCNAALIVSYESSLFLDASEHNVKSRMVSMQRECSKPVVWWVE